MESTKRIVKEKRRRDVYELHFIQGLQIQEIADKLDWSYMTIQKDIQVIKDQLNERYKEKPEELLMGILQSKREKIADIEKEYRIAEDYKKRAIRKELNESQKELTELTMKVGIIRQAPIETHAVNLTLDVTPEQLLRQWIKLEPKPDTRSKQETVIQ